eukprot:356621-Chlamydomonas_euryale.AAC.6
MRAYLLRSDQCRHTLRLVGGVQWQYWQVAASCARVLSIPADSASGDGCLWCQRGVGCHV